MAKWKVVFTDSEYENINTEIEVLAKVDAEIFVYQVKDEKDVMAVVGDCDAVIMQYANLTRPVIESMKKCQIISKTAIGLDRIDIAAATEHNICVAHVKDYCIDEVSTHAVALILDLNRKISLLNKTTKSGVWNYKVAKNIYNLRGLTLGFNSFGKIAQLTAEKMKPFGVEIISYDPFVPAEVAAQHDVKLVSFEELVAKSDTLSTHVPDMPATRGMFNKDVFKNMKNTAYIINTGRGPVIKEEDLIWALQNKEIAGAALDVTDPEPIRPGNPLLEMDNVILTPHAAFYSEESQKKLQRLVAENVAQRLQGYAPRFFANPELKEKLGLKDLVD
jgi:D-3-phosphoglycerate dehydrogenase